MKQVFLVEDERALLRELVETFPWEQEQCQVAGTAGTLSEARRGLEQIKADILITDIRLPDGNGLDLINESAVSTAIVITGYHEITLAQRALRMGALDFLLKPLDDDELRAAVQRAVSITSPANVPGSHRVLALVDVTPTENPLVLKALKFIERNFQSDVSLSEAAEHLGITEGHLAGVFKAETGKTFVQVLTAYRMNVATTLFRNSRYNVSDVARRCGYKDPAYFAKVFRRFYHVNPAAYRRRV
ncbi:MAG: helix-turn-helix domain-containing protein [Spirochaeta sp.]|jgi:two-component system response regulator YesN|nr:helix-turn-helix domain-containing protein [Spirochaeta sp.]